MAESIFAEREYERQFEPVSDEGLVEIFREMTEPELLSELSYALGDIPTLGDAPIEFGSLQAMLIRMADEFDNWPTPSQNFEAYAGLIMWAMFKRIKEYRG